MVPSYSGPEAKIGRGRGYRNEKAPKRDPQRGVIHDH